MFKFRFEIENNALHVPILSYKCPLDLDDKFPESFRAVCTDTNMVFWVQNDQGAKAL